MNSRIVFLLLMVTGLAGCSFVPLYSYSNQESERASAPVPRPVQNAYRVVSLRPLLPSDVPSSASKMAA